MEKFDIEQVIRILGLEMRAELADESRDFDVACRIAINKLKKCKEYEDLEEQGLLLKLPCKVGDTVYEICDGFIEPCTVEVIFLADYTDKDGKHSYMAEIHYDREDCPYVSTEIYFTDFGKTVFLTQAEAEEELKRMERKNPRSEQVKRCGNAVCPPIPAALVKVNLPELCVAERTPNCQIKEEQTGQLKFA